MSKATNTYKPDCTSSPWETVRELDVPINEHMAEMLFIVTGVPINFWVNREKHYRAAVNHRAGNDVK